MSRAGRKRPGLATDRLLARLDAAEKAGCGARDVAAEPHLLDALVAEALVARDRDRGFAVTAAGRARLARLAVAASGDDIDPFRGQHFAIARRASHSEECTSARGTIVNEAESPLAWLARRKGRDGQPMVTPAQFQAGERLRADFTFAQLTPCMGVDWASPSAGSGGAGGPAALADTVIAARQRLRRALDAAGPEFSGLLVDVCCFLKGLEDVERERGWPSRSGKIVLQLGLDRLARHYGLAGEARGRARTPVRTWLAADAQFTVVANEVETD
ncbi:MAG: DUF6456 domain-containing protein [Xanthobacteraceae bacterium]